MTPARKTKNPKQKTMAPISSPSLHHDPESDPPLSQDPESDPPLSHEPESDPPESHELDPPLSHDPESDPLLHPQSELLDDEPVPLL